MSNKVVWSQGLFLTPEHFQQQDQYNEYQLKRMIKSLSRHGYGLKKLILNKEQLLQGKLGVKEAEGLLKDGTYFSIPERNLLPSLLDLSEVDNINDKRIMLAIAENVDNKKLVAQEINSESSKRYRKELKKVSSINVGEESEIAIEVAEENYQLMVEGKSQDGYECLPIARIKEKKQDGSIELDESFVPVVLDLHASGILSSRMNNLLSLLEHRREKLAAKVMGVDNSTASSIHNYLILQLLNKYLAELQQLLEQEYSIPYELYLGLINLEAELATFYSSARKPQKQMAYSQNMIDECFSQVEASIKQYLSHVLDESAHEIVLEDKGYGVRVAHIDQVELFKQASFVIAVKAEIATRELKEQLPRQIKIGSLSNIRQLVNAQLPGINLSEMSVAPREVPVKKDYSYFAIDSRSPLWNENSTSRSIAFHISGDFPGLDVELWAIKNELS
ncbi:type VI secretion system baseplate subunit TssK [Kangiella koreensis]|uniref:Type VI secretion protein, VC_A0114 family n=1 Tax=Kangiella koreensis (strain DSM 16069 / JCM 12317 / KCTC 12182 / SW-125) TaxID=523791 RepID=C7R9P1_KANKD|nr:type VI secretion system baseplate subunit TssK [Kangiella koreensis]ACV27910.1 type VI secretion protein, VC_A0114 family [Kangiella koreensis DSM 16069]